MPAILGTVLVVLAVLHQGHLPDSHLSLLTSRPLFVVVALREVEIGVVVGPFAAHSVRHGYGSKLHRTTELHILRFLLLPI